LNHKLAVSLALLAGGMAAGCGYDSGSVFRTDIKTVYVPMFESREFRRNLEFMLTEAVKKKIATDTPYRVASREKADTILSGELLEERQAAYAPDFRTRQPRDEQMTMIVRVKWTDQRSGAELFNRPLLLQSTDYLPSAGETEKYTQQKAIERLASRIVAQMYNDW
jgi:hypothetical protein